MAAQFGYIALFISLACCMLPFALFRVKTQKLNIFKSLACISFSGLVCAFFALVYSFIISDVSVINVALNSHINAPLLYKIAAAWGSHEGSLLLWICVLSFYTCWYALKPSSLPAPYQTKVLGIILGLQGLFLLFLIGTSNPLTTLDVLPKTTGRGLNPLLEDPSLSFHPPLLYLGYVGLAIIFAKACAALSFKQPIANWAKEARFWSLIPWTFLTIGIATGSWWAYYELGWGGWWFWDPVENVSLLPWLITTALIHTLIASEKKKVLQRSTYVLSLAGFSLTILGTLLVRGGFLSSLHAFAQTQDRRAFLLILSGLILFYGFVKLIRLSHIHSPSLKTFQGRETFLGASAIWMGLCTLIVLFGTLTPLVYEAFFQKFIALGPSFYTQILIPLSLPFFILMGFAGMSLWGHKLPTKNLKTLSLALTASLLGWFLSWMLLFPNQILPSFLIGVAVWICVATLLAILKKPFTLKKLPMGLAHLGIGLFLLGATLEQYGLQEKNIVMTAGQTIPFADLQVTLDRVDYKAGPYFRVENAKFSIKHKSESFTLSPSKRFYPLHKSITSESALRISPTGDLIIALGDFVSQNTWKIHLSWHPFAWLLWFSALLIALGGAFSIFFRART